MAPEKSDQKMVMMTISSATNLETNGHDQEAFHMYLRSVRGVCDLLEAGLPQPEDCCQMVMLAKQCLDRLQHLAQIVAENSTSAGGESQHAPAPEQESSLEQRLRRLRGGAPPAETWSTYRAASFCEPPAAGSGSEDEDDEPLSIEDNRLAPLPTAAGAPEPGNTGENGPLEDGETRAPSPADSEHTFCCEALHPRFPIPKPVETLEEGGDPSPLDVARRENERLVASYAMRMQRSAAHVQHNLRLELQRRLTENRQIASLKHRAWLQRRHEARQHHLQVAKRVFASSAGGAASSDELQKQTTYAEVLQFEATHAWTAQLHRSLDQAPASERAVENALLHMLLEKSHPLSKLRQRLQYSLYCKISPVVEQHEHLLEAVRVPAWCPLTASAARGATEAGESVDGAAPDSPAVSRPPSPVGETDCGLASGASLELTEPAGWPPDAADSEELLQQTEAFRRHLRNVISDTQDGVRLLESLSAAVHPALSGAAARAVLQRLLFTPLWPHLLLLFRLANWRQERALSVALRRRLAAGEGGRPAAAARRLLRRLLQAAAPADKCRLLVELVRQLCESEGGPGGADLLLPRLSQLLVTAAAPQLLSELHFISEFMSDGSFQGEQGYCLTSLQTVLMYLVQPED